MPLDSQSPQIILLNGASSSGKSTLSKALVKALPYPCFYYSSDLLVDGGMLPNVDRVTKDTPWSWNLIRPNFFDGFHRTIPAFAAAGNCLLVEHIVEYPAWLTDLVKLLATYRVLYVGVMCPAEEIARREHARGDRTIGEGQSHLDDGIHTWSSYDLEVNTHDATVEQNVECILEAIKQYDVHRSMFRRLLTTL